MLLKVTTVKNAQSSTIGIKSMGFNFKSLNISDITVITVKGIDQAKKN